MTDDPQVPPTPKCRNTTHDHECHPYYARRYDGYCLGCANAGVPALVEKIERWRKEIREVVAALPWHGHGPAIATLEMLLEES